MTHTRLSSWKTVVSVFVVCSAVAGAATVLGQSDCFRRGDSNNDGSVDLSDTINTLNFNFLGTGAVTCEDAADANDDGLVDISDPVQTLRYLFLGEAAPPTPGPLACGTDPTDDALTCEEYTGGCACDAEITVVPAALNFGQVLIGDTAPLSAQLRNSGEGDLVVSSIELCEGTSTDFSWTPPAPLTIGAGTAEILAVTYEPTAVGANEGCLRIASNDPASPTVELLLSGTGTSEVLPPISGTLMGTVTNATTGTPLPDITVALNPSLPGVSLVTDLNGSYSGNVPVGVYTLSVDQEGFEPQTVIRSVLAGVQNVVDMELVPVAPVIVTAVVSGEAVAGGELAAMALVEVLDGSTIEGYSWRQANEGPTAEIIISGADTDNPMVTLATEEGYKEALLAILREPPVREDQLPPNVSLPEGEFPGGLQDRYQVVGINPLSLEETALVVLEVEVTTTSGTYHDEVEIHTHLPWKPAPGLRNVPLRVPVLLYGKTHVDGDGDGTNDATGLVTSYDWALATPSGSKAVLVDPTTQSPSFTPDVQGGYTLTVTDTTQPPGDQVVTIEIWAGRWQGTITAQDDDGRPVASNCVTCHDGSLAEDKFTTWAQSGHAEIFTDNLNTSTHYGPNCFPCHMVGYDPEADNGGADEAADYEDFLAAGLLNNPGDNWTTVLAEYPETAQMANIQCENCHGPQNSGGHAKIEPRVDLSSNVCAVCHGEPLRHARFQQWQVSSHANYELAIDEGGSGNCSRCHTANGFLAWLPVLLDDDPAADPLSNVEVTWTEDETHPQTCVTCHDPHNVGTVTGIETNAIIRISGNTPLLSAGFEAIGVGRGAICMTCHNSRRGLRNDDTWDSFLGTSEIGRAPHGSAQTDVVMGQNAYLMKVGTRGAHSFVEDTCVNCHMEQTPPPDILSYNQGGTNHTFSARTDICSRCHGEAFNAAGVQAAVENALHDLENQIEDAIVALMSDQVALGNTIDLNGVRLITDTAEIVEVVFAESHGRQAITVTFTDGATEGPFRMTDIDVLDGSSTVLGNLYELADERLPKAGWNYSLIHNDGSLGVHNPSFSLAVLEAARQALIELGGS